MGNKSSQVEFSSELTAMNEPIIDGVPQNLSNIEGVDWNVFMEEDPTGYFGVDGLETMSNILKNPIFSQNQFNEKMIQDTFKNKTYDELEDYIEELLRSNYRM